MMKSNPGSIKVSSGIDGVIIKVSISIYGHARHCFAKSKLRQIYKLLGRQFCLPYLENPVIKSQNTQSGNDTAEKVMSRFWKVVIKDVQVIAMTISIFTLVCNRFIPKLVVEAIAVWGCHHHCWYKQNATCLEHKDDYVWWTLWVAHQCWDEGKPASERQHFVGISMMEGYRLYRLSQLRRASIGQIHRHWLLLKR